ncbi:MAG: hypothetical protein U0838_05600 [Chloroflexota bacterium]
MSVADMMQSAMRDPNAFRAQMEQQAAAMQAEAMRQQAEVMAAAQAAVRSREAADPGRLDAAGRAAWCDHGLLPRTGGSHGVRRRRHEAPRGPPFRRWRRGARVIERTARLAQRTPSAGFSQGQRLMVVMDPAVRREVGRICGDEDAARRSAAG